MCKILVNTKEQNLEVSKNLLKLNKKELLFKDEWKSYIKNCGGSTECINLINNLGDSKAVISGQQVSFLGGSNLIINKIFSLINLTDYLQKSLSVSCIPIFWLQTEDQDLEEISDINYSSDLLNYKKINLNNFSNNRVSVGDLELHKFLPDRIDIINNFSTEKVKNAINYYYSKNSFGEAFASLIYSLFPNIKVLFFDSRILKVSKYANKIFAETINNQESIANILSFREQELIKNNKKIQIPTRDDTSLFFYHKENGERYRLNKENKLPKEELIKQLENNPSLFSSSALLRPIIQDYLFDTLAYIGGDSELLYHDQIDPLYEYFNISIPLRINRTKSLFLYEKNLDFFHTLGMNQKVLFESINKFKEDLNYRDSLVTTSDHKVVFEKMNSLSEVIKGLTTSDKNLEKPTNKVISGINKSVTKFLKKFDREKNIKDDIFNKRLKKLEDITWPTNNLNNKKINQERLMSWLFLYDQDETIFDNLNSEIDNSIRNNIKIYEK